MASKKDSPPTLAERLLAVLEAQRGLGTESYPLTLQRLVELTDPQATPELVEKALGKKPFKERALVAQKKNYAAPVTLIEDVEQLASSPMLLEMLLGQLCAPTSPTCPPSKLKAKVDARLKKPFDEAVAKQISEQTLPPTVGCVIEKKKPLLYLTSNPPPPPPPPKPKPEVLLAESLLRVLESQRTLGGAAYPLSLKELVDRTDAKAKPALVNKALSQPALQGRLAVSSARDQSAPLAFVEDSGQVLEQLLRSKHQPTDNTIPVEKLLPTMSERCRPFIEAVHRQIETNSLPPTMGWLWIGNKKQLFFLDDVHRAAVKAPPSPPMPAPILHDAPVDFAHAFDAAFNQLDQQKGAHNFVSLVDLRLALPMARAVFDAELRKLRIAGRYTLSGAEGRHGITPADHEAGIVEHGSLLLYVSRKTP